MAGRVKASARKSVPGYWALMSASRRSQKGMGFVCGLSTRKIVTPWLIHSSMTSRTAW